MNFPHGETAAQELGVCFVSTVAKTSPGEGETHASYLTGGCTVHSPLRVHTVNEAAVQVMTNLPVDAIPIEMTVDEPSCENGVTKREERKRQTGGSRQGTGDCGIQETVLYDS